jgi:hypothetical protein
LVFIKFCIAMCASNYDNIKMLEYVGTHWKRKSVENEAFEIISVEYGVAPYPTSWKIKVLWLDVNPEEDYNTGRPTIGHYSVGYFKGRNEWKRGRVRI